MRMSKKKRKSIKSDILISVVIISVIFVIIYSWNYPSVPKEFVTNETFERATGIFFDYETTRFPSNVEIVLPQEEGMKIGFVIDPWNLNFGIIPTGGNYGTRHIILVNSEDRNVRVDINVYGTIKPLVSVSQNNFILQSGKSVTVDIYLNTTNSTKPGNYTGEIDVVIKKPRYSLLSWLV